MSHIGKYLIERSLGEGAFGQVYLIKDPLNGNLFGMKSMLLSKSKNIMNEVEMLLNEKLSSEFLVKYHSHFSDEKFMYVTMEYMEDNLQDWMDKQREPLSEPVVLSVLAQVVEGISVLHTNGLVHCDIKPQNILINRFNEVKLCDFGLMKNEQQMLSGSLTATWGGGTMGYIPKEIMNGEKPTQAADMFAVGCTTYKLVMKQGPFDSVTPFLMVERVMRNEYKPINREGYTDEFKKLVYSLLSSDPDKRPTAAQLKIHPLLSSTLQALPPRRPIPLASSLSTTAAGASVGPGGGTDTGAVPRLNLQGGLSGVGTNSETEREKVVIDADVAEFITNTVTNMSNAGSPPLSLPDFRALFLDVVGRKATLDETNMFLRLQSKTFPFSSRIGESPPPPPLSSSHPPFPTSYSYSSTSLPSSSASLSSFSSGPTPPVSYAYSSASLPASSSSFSPGPNPSSSSPSPSTSNRSGAYAYVPRSAGSVDKPFPVPSPAPAPAPASPSSPSSSNRSGTYAYVPPSKESKISPPPAHPSAPTRTAPTSAAACGRSSGCPSSPSSAGGMGGLLRDLLDLFGEDEGVEEKGNKESARTNPGAPSTSSTTPAGKRKDPPIVRELELTLDQFYTGCTKKLKIERKLLPPPLSPSAATPRVGPGAGAGPPAPGQGQGQGQRPSQTETRIMQVEVKPGYGEGTRFTFEGYGDERVAGVEAADVVVVLKQKPHAVFTREKNNLHATVTIGAGEAQAHAKGGFQKVIEFLNGETCFLHSNKTIVTGDVLTVVGKGMPLSKKPEVKGDLIVKFIVKY